MSTAITERGKHQKDKSSKSSSNTSDEEDPSFRIRLLMHSRDIGIIIGTKGSNAKRFQEISGAKIEVTKPGSYLRVVNIYGGVNSCCKAVNCIAKEIESERIRNNTQAKTIDLEINFLVLKYQVSCLIGVGGSIINEIQVKTKSKIVINTEPLLDSDEQSVNITGTASQVSNAIYHLSWQLIDNPISDYSRLDIKLFDPLKSEKKDRYRDKRDRSKFQNRDGNKHDLRDLSPARDPSDRDVHKKRHKRSRSRDRDMYSSVNMLPPHMSMPHMNAMPPNYGPPQPYVYDYRYPPQMLYPPPDTNSNANIPLDNTSNVNYSQYPPPHAYTQPYSNVNIPILSQHAQPQLQFTLEQIQKALQQNQTSPTSFPKPV